MFHSELVLSLCRWSWCSLVQGLSQFKKWCSVCMNWQTRGHVGPLMNPLQKGEKVRKFKAPHTVQRIPSRAQMRQRALSQGRTPSKGWSSLTAHGTRPTRSAQTNDCKVIVNDCVCAEGLRQLVIVGVEFDFCHRAVWRDLARCSVWPRNPLTDACSPPDLLRVELKTRKTCFWRSQKGKPDTYLATIEAIYYFLKDFREHCLAQEYDGEYDNLLFFYSFLHSIVNKAKTSAGKCWGTLRGQTWTVVKEWIHIPGLLWFWWVIFYACGIFILYEILFV